MDPAPQFKTVYTAEEFTKEVLRDKRSVKWTRAQCRRKRIKTVAVAPYLIPGSEARRMAGLQ